MIVITSKGLCKKQADEAKNSEEGEKGRQDAVEGVAERLEGETEREGRPKTGRGYC